MYEYRATAIRAVDGDTIEVIIDLGFYTHTVQRVRLLGIDTPERGEPNFAAAKAFVQAWLDDHPFLRLWSYKPESQSRDKYKRFLAQVHALDTHESLNDAVQKYAKPV